MPPQLFAVFAEKLFYARRKHPGESLSGEFTVPLCNTHYRRRYDAVSVLDWRTGHGIDPLDVASRH